MNPGHATLNSKLGRAIFRLFAAIFLSLASHSLLAADPLEAAATSLTMEYHTTGPAARLPLKKYMERKGLKQLERWRKDGLLKNYKVLFSRYVDSNNWDMMTFLEFPGVKELAQWREIEARMPAGLAPEALAFVKAVHSNPVDRFFHSTASDGNIQSGKDSSVFLIIPYDYLVSTNEYLKYAAGYIVPQFDGWIQEGIVTRYDIYLGRYAVDRHWSSLLVLEYKNDEALGLRERTIAKVRARLRENPEWKAISDNKDKIRVGRSYIMADELRLGH